MAVRPAEAADVPAVFGLVRELAEYEKSAHKITTTEKAMLRDGFGPDPVFGCFVAVVDDKIVGAAIYYYRYSTWNGKRMYLEDFVVSEAHRGKGLGRALFDAVIAKGKATGCTGMQWQVMDWNEPGKNFYRKYYSADIEGGWLNASISF